MAIFCLHLRLSCWGGVLELCVLESGAKTFYHLFILWGEGSNPLHPVSCANISEVICAMCDIDL